MGERRAAALALGLAGAGPRRWRCTLPIGISFFTFQAISYVIDVYRRERRCSASPLDFALYIALFPQLIAGPIVRYRDVAAQLRERRVTRAGLRRRACGASSSGSARRC